MFTKDDIGQAAFDSVLCVHVSMQRPPDPEAPYQLKMTVAYVNKKTGDSFGLLPVQTLMLSQKSTVAFQEFLSSAEEDVGRIVFGTGSVDATEAAPARGAAETNQGLGRGLGGGR